MTHSPPVKSGVFILVVGPSGAGKDALMAAARRAHAGDPDIVFPRRVITRVAQPGAEDHDTLTPEAFAVAEKAGFFALAWGAHGLRYGIPILVLAELAAGRSVVINGSRSVIGAAEGYGFPVAVINVTASPEILAGRIARRGRESAAEVSARVFEIRNEGTLAEGEAAFLAAFAEALSPARRRG